jgi:hypothetical protein
MFPSVSIQNSDFRIDSSLQYHQYTNNNVSESMGFYHLLRNDKLQDFKETLRHQDFYDKSNFTIVPPSGKIMIGRFLEHNLEVIRSVIDSLEYDFNSQSEMLNTRLSFNNHYALRLKPTRYGSNNLIFAPIIYEDTNFYDKEHSQSSKNIITKSSNNNITKESNSSHGYCSMIRSDFTTRITIETNGPISNLQEMFNKSSLKDSSIPTTIHSERKSRVIPPIFTPHPIINNRPSSVLSRPTRCPIVSPTFCHPISYPNRVILHPKINWCCPQERFKNEIIDKGMSCTSGFHNMVNNSATAKYSYSNIRNLMKNSVNVPKFQFSQSERGVRTYHKKNCSKFPTPFSANKTRGVPLKSSVSTSHTCRKSYKIPSTFNKTQKKNFGQLLKSHYSNHDRGNSIRINETNLGRKRFAFGIQALSGAKQCYRMAH